jgi:hypothetical protein
VNRVLRHGPGDSSTHAADPLGHVTAGWLLPDGTTARGLFAVVLDAALPAHDRAASSPRTDVTG